jgi:phosphoribosylformylglycinamidine synthase subunit PurQ / glutaminase
MKDAPLVAVIQFPGSNCEYETAAAVRASGMEAAVFRWNQHREIADASPVAFVLPGGFSFQDRVRAGAVGAKERMMDMVVRLAGDGAPVLGICNGAQILVESGLVPGWSPGTVQAALAANHVRGRSGYLSRWVYARGFHDAWKICPWLGALRDRVIPIPIAHAEGRFVFNRQEETSGRLTECSALVYCRPDGVESPEFPFNPNGSAANLAGIMNPAGNVLAMMPHPERAFWMWQVPHSTQGEWGEARARLDRTRELRSSRGPGALFFQGLALHLGVPEES